MKIGVISDTHGLLRSQAIDLLAGVDRIVHAGDIGAAQIVDSLSAIAPVTAIRGNNDIDGWARAYREEETLDIAGRRLFVLHDVNELRFDPAARGFDVVIFGHSHKPAAQTRGGVLYLNPGSAGPRRFKLPIALATLDLDEDGVRAHIHEIEV